MKIGFIGFGEAAFCICDGLREKGITGIIAYDKMQNDSAAGQLVQKRAEQAAVTLMPSAVETAQQADLLFCAVQSSYALEVCAEIRDTLRKGQIYADLSASSPTIKQEIWRQVEGTGVFFADAAMMGLLPVKRHEVPITASGNGAQALQNAANPLGMKVTVLNDRPGAASAIKLIRSIYMKGYDALLFEMLRAAEAFDVFDEVIANVGASMDGVPFVTLIDWMFPGLGVHAARRAAEMKGTQAMLEECGIDASLTIAIKKQLELIDKMDLHGLYQKGWPEGNGWRTVFHHVNQTTCVK